MAYTLPDLKIDSSLMISKITSFHMISSVNSHTTLYVKGVLDKYPLHIEVEKEGIVIRLQETGEVLLNGVLSKLEISVENDVYYFELLAKSNSVKLDVDKISKIFQKEEPYSKLLRALLQTESAGFISTVDAKAKTPVIQYNETIWEFSKRIAGILDTVIVTDNRLDGAYISLGFPRGKELSTKNDTSFYTHGYNNYVHSMQKDRLLENHGNTIALRVNDFYSIGDYMYHDGEKLLVVSQEIILESGVLNCYCQFGSISSSEQLNTYNASSNGVVLYGKVIDVKGEKLKVHFDIDMYSPDENNVWIPYEPHTNAMFYSMPECGTVVAVKALEHLGFIAIHTMPDMDLSLFPHQDDKYFKIPRGQTLAMLPSKMFIQDNLSSLTLKKSRGQTIETGGLMEVHSMANISLKANTINISSMEQVTLGISECVSGVDLSAKEINIYSQKTKVESKGDNRKQSQKKDFSKSGVLSQAIVSKLVGTTVSRIDVGR